MIIVVIGEIGSGVDSVGRLLAESLGWEFTDVDSLDCAAQARSPLPSAEGPSLMKALSATIDFSTCQWRDLIVSCPALTDEDQRQLRHNHPAVKFVYLKAPNRTDDSFPPVRPVDLVDSEAPVRQSIGVENDSSVLSVDSSQGVEQILEAVLSALILKQRSLEVRTV